MNDPREVIPRHLDSVKLNFFYSSPNNQKGKPPRDPHKFTLCSYRNGNCPRQLFCVAGFSPSWVLYVTGLGFLGKWSVTYFSGWREAAGRMLNKFVKDTHNVHGQLDSSSPTSEPDLFGEDFFSDVTRLPHSKTDPMSSDNKILGRSLGTTK